jgi:hypothetical protein
MADYTSPADESFFAAVGRLTLSWGHIEAAIDYFVMILHWSFGGHQIERVMPWSLQRKIDYIKKYFRKGYPSYPATERICQLMDQIAIASETRHDLIHGFVIEHPDGKSEAKLIRHLRQRDEKFRTKEIHVTTEIILRHAVDANKLGSRLLRLVEGLIGTLTANDGDKPAGKV